MSDEELEKQDKQEQKEEKKEQGKRDLKIVITSIVCTLLFIIILLLLVLLGLKKCNKGNDVNSSSSESSSSEPKYNYDNTKLNDVFKKIVFNQVYVDMGTEDTVDEIIAVNYVDIDNKFTLDIDARIDNKIYYYHTSNVEYSNHENFVEYLLTLDTTQALPLITTGEETSISYLDKVEEKLTSEIVGSHYYISSSGLSKYLSGYYFNNSSNEYCVYSKKELINTDAFPTNPSIKIGLDSPLYGYYQSLNN